MLSEIGRERLTESYKAQAQHPKFEAYAKDNTLRKSNRSSRLGAGSGAREDGQRH